MRITFLYYCHFNVFQATLRMSSRKTDVRPPGYLFTLQENSCSEYFNRKVGK